jgi:hypothetical protein
MSNAIKIGDLTIDSFKVGAADCSIYLGTTKLYPEEPPHEYVDLGLPSGTLWATKNIGASSETDYGEYYMYGKGADDYTVTSGQSEYFGTEDPLASSADTATQLWGGQWQMPTSAQCQELIDNTTCTWETNFNGSGVVGAKFTNNSDSTKYIFLPASGYLYNGSGDYVGERCYYSTSTPDDGFNSRELSVRYVVPIQNFIKEVVILTRIAGSPIRPVIG